MSFSALQEVNDLPANFCFIFDKFHNKPMGIYIPRTSEIPSKLSIPRDRNIWKFGTFEVMGLFDAKDDSTFENSVEESPKRRFDR